MSRDNRLVPAAGPRSPHTGHAGGANGLAMHFCRRCGRTSRRVGERVEANRHCSSASSDSTPHADANASDGSSSHSASWLKAMKASAVVAGGSTWRAADLGVRLCRGKIDGTAAARDAATMDGCAPLPRAVRHHHRTRTGAAANATAAPLRSCATLSHCTARLWHHHRARDRTRPRNAQTLTPAHLAPRHLLKICARLAAVLDISQLLQTGLDRKSLETLVGLTECGVNPEALASVGKELRRELPARAAEEAWPQAPAAARPDVDEVARRTSLALVLGSNSSYGYTRR